MRLEREWRWLKSMMWHGFAHEQRAPGPGELTLACPCCPQLEINLPENWVDDTKQ
jgi:hypothetical protein